MAFRYNDVIFVIFIIIVLIPHCHPKHLIKFLTDIHTDVERSNFLPEQMKNSIKPIYNIVFVLFGLAKEMKTFAYYLLAFVGIIHCLFTLNHVSHIPQFTLKNFFIIQTVFTSLKSHTNGLIQKLNTIIQNVFTSFKSQTNHAPHINVSDFFVFFKTFLCAEFCIIHLLFILFKRYRILFLALLLAIQIIVLLSMHYIYVYAYKDGYEPVVHGTYDPNSSEESPFWTFYFRICSSVITISDFLRTFWLGGQGVGTNNYHGVVPY